MPDPSSRSRCLPLDLVRIYPLAEYLRHPPTPTAHSPKEHGSKKQKTLPLLPPKLGTFETDAVLELALKAGRVARESRERDKMKLCLARSNAVRNLARRV